MIDPFFASVIDGDLYKLAPNTAILNAAIKIRRAGLEHLIKSPGPAEIDAMSMAGEVISVERAILNASPLQTLMSMARGQSDNRQSLLEEATMEATQCQ